jgi:hypothetical protein
MEGTIPESRLTAQAIYDITRQILAEGSRMDTATTITVPKKIRKQKKAVEQPPLPPLTSPS